jgi:NAD(P)-dependent dehydrogenase (short-subunit alcohol dehydrogenase family)
VSTGTNGRVTVISGGTDGMGRALALARLARGDRVVAIGSNPDKGRTLPDGITFLRADLTSIADTRRVIATVRERWPVVDALALFANRQAPGRITTVDGLEATFALYYLSRHLLGHGLRDALDRAPTPVIVNVAGVGITKGAIQWDDLQLRRRYRMITAQLQAGRANDLLGVDFAATSGARARYVL